MTGNQGHIIHKLYVEVNTNSKEKAYAIKNEWDVFLKENILPIIEKLFDRIYPEDQGTLRIEQLNLDLSFYNDFTKEAFKKQTLQCLEQKIQRIKQNISEDKSSSSGAELATPGNSRIAAFFHFLKFGSSPWYAQTQTMEFLENPLSYAELITENGFILQFKNAVLRANERRRWIHQFTDKQLLQTIAKAYPEHPLAKSLLQSKNQDVILDFLTLSKSNENIREYFWEYLVAVFQVTDVPSSLWKSILEQIQLRDNHKKENSFWERQFIHNIKSLTRFGSLPKTYESSSLLEAQIHQNINNNQDISEDRSRSKDNLIKDELEHSMPSPNAEEDNRQDRYKEKPEFPDIEKPEFLDMEKSKFLEMEESKFPDEKKSYFMEHAGLILAHPFLENFFIACNVYESEKGFTDVDMAIHALHYLVTKKEEASEATMGFEKFICDVPIHQPIKRFIKLSDDQKQEAENVLSAIVSYWGALQNSHPDLIRNEFLSRSGKLLLSEKNPKIILERKTQDILLDRLPWNISVIKLPWKEKIIFADW